jgi:hypothetical protein
MENKNQPEPVDNCTKRNIRSMKVEEWIIPESDPNNMQVHPILGNIVYAYILNPRGRQKSRKQHSDPTSQQKTHHNVDKYQRWQASIQTKAGNIGYMWNFGNVYP